VRNVLKLACADFTFPILPHDQVLQLIALLGIKGVDIGLFEDRSHLQPSTELRSVRRSASKLRRRLDEKGLVAADIFLQMALDYTSHAVNHPRSDRRRKARDVFVRTLDYTAECGGNHLTALPGVCHEQESRSDSWSRMVEELVWRVERASDHRITFAVEPHIGSIADTPKRAKRLIRDVPGLTLTLDYGHLFPRGHSETTIEQLIQHASHFHARGVNRRSGGVCLEDNTLDWRRIFRKMSQTGYCGWIELEYGGNNLTDTVALRDHFRRLYGERRDRGC
jgi:sugar phosphate isomerase/epimerase